MFAEALYQVRRNYELAMFAVVDTERKRAVQYFSRAEDARADAARRNFDHQCFLDEKALKMAQEGR